ncbi:DNA-processing protein DprA [Terracidiphilus gabretensis]|uniref:DNA-processing protein DprA n=1 Tax=Terracidiphilus gabretensis TaxID=1577687 RepID=UPI00071BD111|nr:DNA-processing protein DprA [Terracidiphilus gabretensis]
MPKSQKCLPSVHTIKPDEPEYPASVIEMYAPKGAPTLYCAGNLSLINVLGIGICGSRKSSEKGIETVKDCAEQIAKSAKPVVSGNAAGIDVAAHRAALEAGGSTILVLPEGIHHFRIRKELYDVWDWSRVLVVSQFEPDAPWSVYRAMDRNRVIIALSRAMIVVEAGESGGTVAAGLSTLKAGKPLYVAVYENMPERAPGNEKLLQLGGKKVFKGRLTGRAKMAELFADISAPSARLQAPENYELSPA